MVTNRVARIVLEVLMGLAAVGSGIGLILTNGLGMPLESLEGSPFGSYTIPGLVLLLVGVINLVGAATVLRRSSIGVGGLDVGGVVLGCRSRPRKLAATLLLRGRPADTPACGTVVDRAVSDAKCIDVSSSTRSHDGQPASIEG